MFRVVLAIYTLMLSLMGPSPCCCSVALVAKTTLSVIGISGNSEIQWPACCHEQPGETTNDSSGDQSPDSPRHPGGDCQCVQSYCKAVPALPTEFTVDMSRSWLDHLILDFGAPVLLEVEDSSLVSLPPDEVPPAPLSGREIRIALRSWLC